MRNVIAQGDCNPCGGNFELYIFGKFSDFYPDCGSYDLRNTLFIKINDRNTLFTDYNIHDKVCFLFNNTDSHISRLTVNFVFQAFERPQKQN